MLTANGLLFEAPSVGLHVGVRRAVGDKIWTYQNVPIEAFAGGKRRVVTHLGFAGGPGASSFVNAKMQLSWLNDDLAVIAVILGDVLKVADGGGVMQLFDREVNAALAPAGAKYLRIVVEFSGDAYDAATADPIGFRLFHNVRTQLSAAPHTGGPIQYET